MDPFPHELNAAVGYLTVLVIKQAGNGLQGRALAGAVRPEKSHDPFFRNFDGHPFEDKDDLVVPDLESC